VLSLLPLFVVRAQEVALSDADYKKLDSVEAAALAKADRKFAAKDYRVAATEYDIFLEEFPRVSAAAYALLRKGRSQMLDNKRNEAVRTFKEVIDYFPDAVLYAAAAHYYQAVCHFANGDRMNAVKVWQAMVKDKGYAKHTLAAPALMSLGDEFVRQGKHAEAVPYYEQAAVDFRSGNAEVARKAYEQACWIHVRVIPNEKRLRSIDFRHRTGKEPPDEEPGFDYWNGVLGSVNRWGGFGAGEEQQQAAYCKYWADLLDGKFLDKNEYRFGVAELRLRHEGDMAAWVQRVDQQFAATYKIGDHALILRCMQVFGSKKQKAKVEEYYAKLDFSKMDNAAIYNLARVIVETLGDLAMARNACEKLDHAQWNDQDRNNFVGWVQHHDETMTVMVCQRMKDRDFGVYRLLQYFHWRRNHEKGLPLADESVKVPNYAAPAYWMKAELLEWSGKNEEAILAYRSSNREPDSLFRIADCFRRLNKKDEALAQLQEIENFFEAVAPEAAIRIAWIHRDAQDQKRYVGALRAIMKKYPRSGQSNTAHIELERLGVKMGGGVDAE